MLEVSPQRAALIRGLFELAAFVADHPELPLPFVEAVAFPIDESFSRDMRVIEAVAEALGVSAALVEGRGYSAQRKFGPCVSARWVAYPTPYGCEDGPVGARLGHAGAAESRAVYGGETR